MSNNTLYVIGYNKNGELGLGHQENMTQLTNWNKINEDISVTDIKTGVGHTIFTDSDTNYWSVGANDCGQCLLDIASRYIPSCTKITHFDEQQIKISKIYTSIQNKNSFCITNEKKLFVNGDSVQPALGPWRDNDINSNTAMVEQLHNVIEVTGGAYHDIAICGSFLRIDRITNIVQHWFNKYLPQDLVSTIANYYNIKNKVHSILRTLWALRLDDYGQHGHGLNELDQNIWNVVDCFNDKLILQIACGEYHSLFLSDAGEIFACGCNEFHQLGLIQRGKTRKHLPKAIEFLVKGKVFVTQIRCGGNHSLCIDSNHRIYSWGNNGFGQCGQGTRISISSPQIIEALSGNNIVDIKCGSCHSYAKTEEGQHFLFGHNWYKQCSLMADDKHEILLPHRINDIVERITARKIETIFLGGMNTFIIVGCVANNNEMSKRKWLCTQCNLVNVAKSMQCQACFSMKKTQNDYYVNAQQFKTRNRFNPISE